MLVLVSLQVNALSETWGPEVRFDYSVIGDAVNLGARLEGQTRNYDGVDVLSSETYRQCPNRKFSRS